MTTSDVVLRACIALGGLGHYRRWRYEDLAIALYGDPRHPPIHSVTLAGDYMVQGWHSEGHARFAAAAPELVTDLVAEVSRLRAQIAAVRELHRPIEDCGYEPSGEEVDHYCASCVQQWTPGEPLIYEPWPCPTIRALDGEATT